MEYPIEVLAVVAYVDQRLDELNEDFGDLPQIIEQKTFKLNEQTKLVEETKSILKEVKSFCSKTKITLVDLKDKEEKLTEQQFHVRNNKEFDAISNEIKTLKEEHKKLSEQLRAEGLKEENLIQILASQEADLEKLKVELAEKEKEHSALSAGQNDELEELKSKKEKLVSKLPENLYNDYARIRLMHLDAAVRVYKNSCSGCYNAIPAQKIVELRNNRQQILICENCGRIVTPEEYVVDDEMIDNLKA